MFTAAAVAGTIPGAATGFAVGAADALLAVFFGFDYVENRAANNRYKDQRHNNVRTVHRYASFFVIIS